ncbi:MAG: endolytic transglycosylase MltG [candidate division Zixibacteria bacterium]|nr:endolytic transglycosylase MltG [candidate division Zixibacteria bacterium]
MNKKDNKVKVNFWDYLIFVLSSIGIFLSSIILALSSFLFFSFKFLTRRSSWFIMGLASVTFASAFLIYWFIFPLPWKVSQESLSLMVKEGVNMRQVIEQLKELGMVSEGRVFILVGKITGLDKKIQPGRYDFHKGITRYSVLRKLVRGEIIYTDVTIPEGLTVKQIAGVLKNSIGVDSAEFVRITHNRRLIDSLGIESSNLEGYLFPNTYNLYPGISSNKIVEEMVGEFNKIFDGNLRQRAKQIGFSIHKVVTLASMVEKETQIDEERPIISSVFHNRLKLGMPLQCDPTVIYALSGLDRPLYTKDLQINSPYNTYKYYGLPPGPICSPGEKSIIAALYPSKTDYLYFVAKKNGNHIFSNRLAEHNRARHDIRKLSATQSK